MIEKEVAGGAAAYPLKIDPLPSKNIFKLLKNNDILTYTHIQ